MHIVILPSWYWEPERPGSGIFFKQQALALASKGCRVTIVYYETRSLKVFSLKKLFKENYFQVFENRDNGVLEFSIKGWSPRPQTKIGMKLWVWLTNRAFKKYILCYGKPDIIHAHSAVWAGYLAARIKDRHQIPFLITEHSSAFIMNQIPCWYNKYILYSFKRSSEIFAVSNILATSIKNTFGEFEIRILPNFVDLSVFSNYKLASDLNNQGSFIFLSIGNLNFYKGFDILLQSFAKAFISDKNVKLYIAGIGEIDKELKDITLKMGISDQVIFLGHLSQPEVREYLYLSDAFVLASRFETFGIVYIEAMACGKPVIATTCGGPEEFVDSECGYLVPKDNIHELATALVEMKKNKHNFNSEIIIQKISDKFDSKKLAAQLIEVYQTIL